MSLVVLLDVGLPKHHTSPSLRIASTISRFLDSVYFVQNITFYKREITYFICFVAFC